MSFRHKKTRNQLVSMFQSPNLDNALIRFRWAKSVVFRQLDPLICCSTGPSDPFSLDNSLAVVSSRLLCRLRAPIDSGTGIRTGGR